MKSPLKAKPLRNPGESLDRDIQEVLDDDVLFYLLLAAVFLVLAGMEWWRWYIQAPRTPLLFSIVAAITVAVAGWKVRNALSKIKRIKLGRDGEKVVGQFLDRLREQGARVFHDIPGEGFNLDHVVVHTSGIYVIETKTLSKPDRGKANLRFDGESISKQGLALDRNPVTQVRASRKWLFDLLRESTGRGFPVKPVVVFSGWFIEPTAEAKGSDVWVLNPRALPAFIGNSRERIKSDNVNLCAYHLERYVRAS